MDDARPVAAARELHEETGLAVAPEELGEPVAYTAGYAEVDLLAGHRPPTPVELPWHH